MIPRLSRPLFRHWSEIPLFVGLLVTTILAVRCGLHHWRVIQSYGGLVRVLRELVGW